ncbi:MAG: WbqC family protein, partial [Desulfobacteraceae bacterium]
MIVSVNQPYFAPYPGFFLKANLSDYFVILDDVQFPRGTTWISRNRFKNDQGTLWMTVPVHKKGLGLQKISDLRICHPGNWGKKHLRSFRNAYAHAPYLHEHLGLMERVLSEQFDRLLEFNMEIIDYILGYLGIDTRLVPMSRLGVTGKGTPLIIEICKALGATQFMVQSSAVGYYHPALFESAGIELISYKK